MVWKSSSNRMRRNSRGCRQAGLHGQDEAEQTSRCHVIKEKEGREGEETKRIGVKFGIRRDIG